MGRAIVKQLNNVNVLDSMFNLDFVSIQNFAKISAIELLSAETKPSNYEPFVSFPIPDQEMTFEEQSKIINLYKVFSDDVGSVLLKLAVDYIEDTSLLTSVSINGLSLELLKAKGKTGTSKVRIRATDVRGVSATDEFTVFVREPLPVKPRVVKSLADINGKMNTVIPPVDISKTFYDNRGGENLVYSIAKITNRELVRSIQIINNSLKIQLNTNVTGTAAVTVRATDKDGLYAEDEFDVNIVDSTKENFASILINAGGSAIIGESQVWEEDKWYSGGNTFNYDEYIPLPGERVFKTERFGNFSYRVPVRNGTYIVKLYMAELYWKTAGKRLFNVSIENGQAYLREYDIFAKNGAAPLIEKFPPVTVSDGFLDIDFTSLVDNANVSGIEIIQTEVTKVAATPDNRIVNENSISGFKIYPNPVTGNNINIIMPDELKGTGSSLSLVNVQGEVVFRTSNLNSTGYTTNVQLPSSLSKGIYMVIIKKGGDTKMSKLIIQ